MQKNKQRGITLIALVVTIIVLLILAGVTIAAISGDNGILQNAARAKEESEKAEIIEQIRLDITDKQIENQGTINEDEFYEILRKYGTVSSDETILTTTKGNYEILISEIYNLELTDSFNSNTVNITFRNNILSLEANENTKDFNIISSKLNYIEIEKKTNIDSQYRICLLGDDDNFVHLLFHPGQGIKVYETNNDETQEIYTIAYYNELPNYTGASRFKFTLNNNKNLTIELLNEETKTWTNFYNIDIEDVKLKTDFNGNVNFGIVVEKNSVEQNIQYAIYNNTVNSFYYCKSISFLGDSITGSKLEGFNKYPAIVTTKLGSICHVYGYAGSSLSGGQNSIPSFVDRFTNESSENYEEVAKNSDIILIFGGNNGDKTLGSIEDSTGDTTYGAIRILIEYFQNKYPNSKLIFATPIQGSVYNDAKLQRAQAIKEVCQQYNIDVIDLYNNSGITVENASEYLEDGVHPNIKGATLIGNYIAKELLEIQP